MGLALVVFAGVLLAGIPTVTMAGVVALGIMFALLAYDRGTRSASTVVLLVAGVALVFVGVVGVVVASHPELVAAGALSEVVLAAGAAVLGVGALVVPVMVRMAGNLAQEREAKAVEAQRAEIAAHLHDSVLQTLALIQKRADDPAEVVRLARGQERALRAWLFDAPSATTATCFSALQDVAGEVEDRFGVRVRPVTVGKDVAFDEANASLVLAAREAMYNAAKHAGVDAIDVYAEHLGGEMSVYVRDRGVGFDPEGVAQDRHGVRDSIVGRMQRAGGSATVRSAPGEGTEVALSLAV